MTSLFENLKMKGGGDRKPGCPNDVHFKLHKTSKGRSQKHSIFGLNLLLPTLPPPVIDLWMEIPSFPPPVDSNGTSLFPSENIKCFTNFNKNIITFCNYYKSENIVIRIEAPKDNWTKTNYTTNTQIFDYISSRFSFYEDNGDYTLNYLISQLTTVKNLYFLPYVQGNFSSPPLTTLSNPQDYKDNRDAFWTAVEFTNWYIKNKLSSIKVSSGSLNFKIQLVIEPENMGLPGIKYRDGDAPTALLVNKPNPCAFKGNNLNSIANSVATQINYLFENKDINTLKADLNYEYILNYMPSSIPISSFAATTGTTGGKVINTVYDTNNNQAVTTIFGQWYNFGSYPPFKPDDKKPDNLIKIFKDNIKLADTNKDYYTPLLSIEDGTKRNLDVNAYYGIPSTAYYKNNGSGPLVFETPPGSNKAAPPQLADHYTKGKDFTWSDLEEVVAKIKQNNFSTSSGSASIKNVMIFGAHYLERNLGAADVTVRLTADNSTSNQQIEGLGPDSNDYSGVQPYRYNNYGQFSSNLTFK